MISLNNFLQEGLKINSKSKVNTEEKLTINKLFKIWCFGENFHISNPSYYETRLTCISDWLEKNKDKKIYFAAYKTTISPKTGYKIDNNFIREYNTDESYVAELEYDIDHNGKMQYQNHILGFDIITTNDVMAICSPLGTMYCTTIN